MNYLKAFSRGTLAFVFGVVLFAPVSWAQNAQMSHLSFYNNSVHAHLIWEVGPQVRKESVLRIEWRGGTDHKPMNPPGAFDVELWMPSMDHGSSPVKIEPIPVEVGKFPAGTYRVSKMYFVMGGEWEVRVTLKKEGANADTQRILVKL